MPMLLPLAPDFLGPKAYRIFSSVVAQVTLNLHGPNPLSLVRHTTAMLSQKLRSTNPALNMKRITLAVVDKGTCTRRRTLGHTKDSLIN